MRVMAALARDPDRPTVILVDDDPAVTHAMQFSFDLEGGYDHVIVEARTAGGEDWTTRPELGGATSQAVPTECEVGFLLDLHPFLANYLGGADCTEPGATGTLLAASGDTIIILVFSMQH